MIIDGLLEYSVAQAVTATADSTNILDFGAAEDLGVTERPLQVWVDFTTAPVFSNPGTTTLAISLLTSPTGTGSWTTLLTTPPSTTLSAGVLNPIDVPQGCMRYTKLNYAVASGSLTAGTVSAGLNLDTDGIRYYARGYTA